jgi:hypothetical protein
MWRLLKFLVTGDWHLHEWETVSTGPLARFDRDRNVSVKVGDYINLRCKHCGIHKQQRFIK